VGSDGIAGLKQARLRTEAEYGRGLLDEAGQSSVSDLVEKIAVAFV
jgi:hypothetical protein